MLSFLFWQGPFHAQLNFQQQIEKHLVADFSILELTMEYDDYWGSQSHGFGPFVLHLLEMHRIRAATRRLQIQFLRRQVILSLLTNYTTYFWYLFEPIFF
jgi:hypothetical protein